MSRPTYSIEVNPTWLEEAQWDDTRLEALREHAEFKTGSISVASSIYLRTLCHHIQPKIVIEIGTFIGKSLHAMLREPSVGHIYTCDMHNDCIQSSPRVTCFPKQTSTQMLGQLVEKGVKADLFFFDGRLSPADVPLILRCSTWQTIYAFDDYHENPPGEQFPFGKGVWNVGLLQPFLKEHVLIDPPEKIGDLDSWTTIAVLVPKELL